MLVTTLDDQVLGDPFTLDCTVITVIGISSAVDIIWSVDGKTVRIVYDTSATISNNSAIYTDSFALPELTALDNGRTYQCTVVINKNPPASFSGSMMLNFFGKPYTLCGLSMNAHSIYLCVVAYSLITLWCSISICETIQSLKVIHRLPKY